MSRAACVLLRILTSMNPTPARLSVNQSEAAEMVGLSLRTIQNLIRSQQLPIRKIGRRTVIEVRALEELLAQDRTLTAPVVRTQRKTNS